MNHFNFQMLLDPNSCFAANSCFVSNVLLKSVLFAGIVITCIKKYTNIFPTKCRNVAILLDTHQCNICYVSGNPRGAGDSSRFWSEVARSWSATPYSNCLCRVWKRGQGAVNLFLNFQESERDVEVKKSLIVWMYKTLSHSYICARVHMCMCVKGFGSV